MKVGFVSIVGRTNVGKSSLVNAILNYSLSIVTPTIQTTRDQIKGIYNDQESQIIFLDTPGIHKPKQELGNNLNKAAYNSLKDADLVLFLTPSDQEIGKGDLKILEKIKDSLFFVVLTKTDQVTIQEIDQKIKALQKLGIKEIYSCSIFNPKSLQFLVTNIKKVLSENPLFYDQEQITDSSMRFLAKEIIREFAINQTKQEVPHSLGVLIDEFDEQEKTCNIQATLFVERDSQKGILIGKEGKVIKTIGTLARKKMEKNFNSKVNLNLKVKVLKNWTKKPHLIQKMGY